MNDSLQLLLSLAEGPLFRLAFALMILGLARALLLGFWHAVAAYLVLPDRSAFWRKLNARLLWFAFPSLLLRRMPEPPRCSVSYHAVLDFVSLLFRVTAVVVPAFMVEHVYLWKRHLGLSWVSLSARTADVLTVVVIVTGLAVFLGRLYSPWLRRTEPPWSFLKPLILILPFASGMLALHPTFSPLDYHVVRLAHALSASLVFVLIAFGRLLSAMQVPVTQVLPETAWPEPDTMPATPAVTIEPEG